MPTTQVPPGTTELSFQEHACAFPTSWRVTVSAICPECGEGAVFGGLEGGGWLIRCSACSYADQHKGESQAAVLETVLKIAATMARPKSP